MINAVLYTDGSAAIRPDGTFLCGYAYVFVVDGVPVIGKAFPGVGTINQAEMCAVYKGMEDALIHHINVTAVYTDSTYVVNGLQTNYEKYDTNEWTNAQGSEVSNKEMWIRIIEFTRKHNIQIPATHIKGHTGQPFNELCDKLAKEAAMSQMPVVEYSDIDKASSMGFNVPETTNPFPISAVAGDPVMPEEVADITKVLKTYTDDRNKCCYIRYPDMLTVFASKSISTWEGQPNTDSLNTTYTIHPVLVNTDDGGTTQLPLYRYMTEKGTPFEVITSNSTVQWQGCDFNRALLEATANIKDGHDLIIASYNLASAKKFQGIYFIGYSSATGAGEILSMYRTERIPHGKFMRIHNGYISTINRYLTDDAAAGIVISTLNLCLIITSYDGGAVIGSSVIPHNIEIQDCITLFADKPDKTNVRVSNMDILKALALDPAIHRVSPSVDLSDVIPDQDYTKDVACMDVMYVDKSGELRENATTSDEIIYNPVHCEESVDCSDHLEVDIKMYLDLRGRIEALFKEQTEVFDRILNTINKYPVMTPEKVAEIKQQTRDEMLDKFNSMFK